MPKGIRVTPELRERVTKAAIKAAEDGTPTWAVAAWFGMPARTLYTWLQWDKAAFEARFEAIRTGKRFARARGIFGEELTEKQVAHRRQMAMRRLAINRREQGIVLRKPRPRKGGPLPRIPEPEIEFVCFGDQVRSGELVT